MQCSALIMSTSVFALGERWEEVAGGGVRRSSLRLVLTTINGELAQFSRHIQLRRMKWKFVFSLSRHY
jgi:hypothetical protein